MSRIIYIPLEHLEERYTPMFNSEIKKYSDFYIYPKDFDNYPQSIEKGQFLDINKTMIFKTSQLNIISKMFYEGDIMDGDIFLFADIFFPGIEGIKYMAELQGLSVKICAFNHAGRADEDDFVQKLGSWSDHSEKGYHEACDLIFFGSNYHRKRVTHYFDIPVEKTLVTGMIWSSQFVDSIYTPPTIIEKINRVIWPHRFSSEKGYLDLLNFATLNPSLDIIVTSCGKINIDKSVNLPENIQLIPHLTKAEYYEALAFSKYYLSTAYQETFGYTLQEAIYFNCEVAVPNRACYPEMVPKECLYESIDLMSFEDVGQPFFNSYDNNVKTIIKACLS